MKSFCDYFNRSHPLCSCYCDGAQSQSLVDVLERMLFSQSLMLCPDIADLLKVALGSDVNHAASLPYVHLSTNSWDTSGVLNRSGMALCEYS
jgi:hypothetical protein